MRYALFMIALLMTATNARAEKIQFPAGELATESVLPVFDQPVAVRSRLVPTAKRVELGVGGNYDLAEPFFNPMGLAVQGSYHFNEDHGLNLLYVNYLGGTTSAADQLNAIQGTNDKLNLQYAPAAKYIGLLSYQYNGFYGKISFTKEWGMNLSLYGLLGVGMFGIGDSSNLVIAPGMGQKFYISPNWALRFDLRMLVYQGPNVVTYNLTKATAPVSASSFTQRTFIGSLLSFGLVYLIPNS